MSGVVVEKKCLLTLRAKDVNGVDLVSVRCTRGLRSITSRVECLTLPLRMICLLTSAWEVYLTSRPPPCSAQPLALPHVEKLYRLTGHGRKRPRAQRFHSPFCRGVFAASQRLGREEVSHTQAARRCEQGEKRNTACWKGPREKRVYRWQIAEAHGIRSSRLTL